MENEYLDNKVILKYCKDYYRIINSSLSFISTEKINV